MLSAGELLSRSLEHFCLSLARSELCNAWPIFGVSRWAKKMNTCASSSHNQDGCSRLEPVAQIGGKQSSWLWPFWWKPRFSLPLYTSMHAIFWIGLHLESQCTEISFPFPKIWSLSNICLSLSFRLRLALSLLNDRFRSSRRRSTDWKVRLFSLQCYQN